MIRRHLAAAAFAVFSTTIIGVGCSSTKIEEVGSQEAMATPSDPGTPFGLAQSCGRLYKRHQSVRQADIQQGFIRWGCGDVAGVTDPDLGQEYCEYQAVQNGKIVRKSSELTTGDVSCVFTAVFTGAGEATALKAAMADPANLGVAAQQNGIVEMQKGFNSRGAATQLVSDCSRQPTATEATKRLRLAACAQAFAAGGPNAAQLEAKCKNGNVSDAATWSEIEALGAKIAVAGDANFEEQRDMANCMNVRGNGVAWRNSDPMICGRVGRSAGECSCRFGAVPNALKGFPFTGWVDDQLPTGCRLAKVANADYPFVAICPVTDQEVSDIPLNPKYVNSIANFCHDRFGVDLVMKLPLRALQQTGTCSTTAGFCKDYMHEAPVQTDAGAGEGGTPPVTDGGAPTTDAGGGDNNNNAGGDPPPSGDPSTDFERSRANHDDSADHSSSSGSRRTEH
jgi:hypothetical protein